MKRLLISLLLLIGIITGAAATVLPPDPTHGYGETLSQKTDFEMSVNHAFPIETAPEYLILIIDGRAFEADGYYILVYREKTLMGIFYDIQFPTEL